MQRREEAKVDSGKKTRSGGGSHVEDTDEEPDTAAL